MYTIRPAEFTYHRPTNLDEAISLLAGNEDARPLAGGHSLLPLMKLRLSTPAAIVDLGRIPGLADISQDGDGVRIGALATHRAIAESALVRATSPVLAETAGLIGDWQVRNCGTIGGSLAHADPGADYPTVLSALGATIVAAGKNGERAIPAEEFVVGVFATALEPGEVITAVTAPATPAGTGAAYAKHAHPASGFAVVGVAAAVSVAGGTCTRARLIVGGVADAPVEAASAAASLTGAPGSPEAIAAAGEEVPAALTRATSDVYASGEYRTHLAKVLAVRALSQAFERAG